MGDEIHAFRVAQQRRGLADTTIERRRKILWHFESWLRRDLMTAAPADIEGFLDSLDLAVRTRYSYLSDLCSFYKFAVKDGRIEANPVEDIDRPKLPRLVPRPINDADLAHAFNSAPPREKAMIALGAFNGLRCKEIAGLQREDLLEHENPPLLIVSHAKGNRQRILPLNERAEMALRVYGLPKRGAVFRNQHDGPLLPTTVSKILGVFFRDVGVDATGHQLRHAFATRLYRETGDLRLVQEMLGHASPNSTAIYAAWNPARAAEVVRKLGIGVDPRQGTLAV